MDEMLQQAKRMLGLIVVYSNNQQKKEQIALTDEDKKKGKTLTPEQEIEIDHYNLYLLEVLQAMLEAISILEDRVRKSKFMAEHSEKEKLEEDMFFKQAMAGQQEHEEKITHAHGDETKAKDVSPEELLARPRQSPMLPADRKVVDFKQASAAQPAEAAEKAMPKKRFSLWPWKRKREDVTKIQQSKISPIRLPELKDEIYKPRGKGKVIEIQSGNKDLDRLHKKIISHDEALGQIKSEMKMERKKGFLFRRK